MGRGIRPIRRLGTAALAMPAALAMLAAACQIGASPGHVSLTVYAAASLRPALQELVTSYVQSHPEVGVESDTDSSAALETRIEQGGPADLFLSADLTNPRKLVDAGIASGTVVAFAGNLLTVIVPASNPAGIAGPADLGRPGVKVIAAGDSVPITRYATQLVANLAREPGYPSSFASDYAANIVSREDNVAAVVTKIGLGEGDAAIVYVTDARASTQVTPIAVPADANVPATYGGVVVKASRNQAAAEAFLSWIAGPDGESILGSFGFLPPS